jgi:hypothetical protein
MISTCVHKYNNSYTTPPSLFQIVWTLRIINILTKGKKKPPVYATEYFISFQFRYNVMQ